MSFDHWDPCHFDLRAIDSSPLDINDYSMLALYLLEHYTSSMLAFNETIDSISVCSPRRGCGWQNSGNQVWSSSSCTMIMRLSSGRNKIHIEAFSINTNTYAWHCLFQLCNSNACSINFAVPYAWQCLFHQLCSSLCMAAVKLLMLL